jgi:hypothetical protein
MKRSISIPVNVTPCISRVWRGVLLALTVFWFAGTCPAAVRLDSTGPPAYARIGTGEIYTDGTWVAIAFYRDPGDIPKDFNLLDFFDPAALETDSYVAGFEVWKHGPWAGDVAPIQAKLTNTGRPMPFWFVSLADLESAMGDNLLTIGELSGLNSLLVGEAEFFTETLHPYGAAQQTMICIVASGRLEDGRAFSYQVLGNQNPPAIRAIKIEFK